MLIGKCDTPLPLKWRGFLRPVPGGTFRRSVGGRYPLRGTHFTQSFCPSVGVHREYTGWLKLVHVVKSRLKPGKAPHRSRSSGAACGGLKPISVMLSRSVIGKSKLPVHTFPRVSGGHTMIRILLTVLLGVVSAGCAAYWRAHTEGTSGPITWYITDAKSDSNPVDERYAYSFALVLRETQGTAITFTTMTYTIYSGTATSPGSDAWTRQGTWKLRARGTYRFPFTYTVTCPEGSGCIKLGPLAPTYHIVLTDTDNQDKPVRVSIDTKLPPDPSVIPKH